MRLFVPIGLLATAACGLDVGGLAVQGEEAGSAESASPVVVTGDGRAPNSTPYEAGHGLPDASPTPQRDAAAPDAAAAPDEAAAPDATSDGGTACQGIPTGWSPAIYDLSTDPCPPNFSPHEVFGPPTVGATPCSCTCSVTQPGSCTQGDLTVTYGISGNGSCPTLSFMATFNGPGCVMLPSQLSVSGSPNNQATPLPPQGGTCTDMVQSDSSQLSAPGARYCEVPADRANAVCGGTVPSGFAACIVASGDIACPSGTPFVQRHVVGDHAVLQCSACSSPCTVSTTCSNAIVTGFTDSACTSRLATAVVDGTCSPITFYTMVPATLVAVEYAATATSSCTTGSSSPTTGLANPRTLCCR